MIEGTEINLAARFFLESGLAVAEELAEQMADILYAPELSADAVLCLLWLGVKKGASFDVVALTDTEISEACDELGQVHLLFMPCAGEA